MEMAERGAGSTIFDRFRIERAISFPETTVGDVMVPMGEVVAIDSRKTTDEAIGLVRRRGFNRLPAYEGDRNNIVGVVTLSTWDLLDPEIPGRPLGDRVRPALYVSPHDSLEELLPVIRAREDQMALVVDEYGSPVGLITMEDIVEAVVGDIDVGYTFEDYVPKQYRRWEKVEDGVYRMDGRLPVHEVNNVLGTHLPTSEYHTIGGMLVARLRHLARVGESCVEGGYRFTVEEATERAILKVRVEREAPGDRG
jgi:CBS domain containing-hemolysin-like protein